MEVISPVWTFPIRNVNERNEGSVEYTLGDTYQSSDRTKKNRCEKLQPGGDVKKHRNSWASVKLAFIKAPPMC